MEEKRQDFNEKIIQLNQELNEKYKSFNQLDKIELKEILQESIGSLIDLKRLDLEELGQYSGQLVGVDGSVNKLGGGHPHYIELYKGLAKHIDKEKEAIEKIEIYTPLLEEQGQEDQEGLRDRKLAEIEVEVAIEAVKAYQPKVLMMDGGLIRYYLYAKEKWDQLRDLCLEKGSLLIGVIEELDSKIIYQGLEDSPIGKSQIYDRELLFGLLDFGQALMVREEKNTKKASGLASLFLRPSKDPNIIGLDILDSQEDHIEDMARLVFSLTPEDSRGIPLWLDIVDEEVKISNKIMEATVKAYLDENIYERFFRQARSKRSRR